MNTYKILWSDLGIFHFGQLWSHGDNYELLHRNSAKREVDSDGGGGGRAGLDSSLRITMTCDPGQATYLLESPLPHQQLKGMYSTPSKPPYCRSNNLIPFIKTTLSVQYFTFSSMPTKCSKMKQRQDLLWVKNLLTQSQCNLTLFNFSHALICDDIQK